MNYNKAPLQTGGYVRCQCPSRAGDPAHTGSMKGHNKPNGLHAGGRPALLFHGVDAAIERGIAGLCRPRVLSARSAPPPDPADRGRHHPRCAAPPAAWVASMISPQAISTRIRFVLFRRYAGLPDQPQVSGRSTARTTAALLACSSCWTRARRAIRALPPFPPVSSPCALRPLPRNQTGEALGLALIIQSLWRRHGKMSCANPTLAPGNDVPGCLSRGRRPRSSRVGVHPPRPGTVSLRLPK